MAEDDWFHDAVAYVYENGLMTGTSATTFSPGTATSRAMMATLLWRLADSPSVDYLMDFTDVEADTWYTEAVRWAASEGIVEGYGNSRFGPNDTITREQMALMFQRYARWLERDVSARAELDGYADADAVSAWALEAMEWAVAGGLISGTGGNMLSPQGSASRAETATLLTRFCSQQDS